MTEAASWLFIVLQLFFVDLLLGVDNAMVIAIACARLKPDDAKRAVVFGAVGAIALRLFMVLFADALLGAPFVKLIAAWILIVVALNIRAGKDGGFRRTRRHRRRRSGVRRRCDRRPRRNDEPRQCRRARLDRKRQFLGAGARRAHEHSDHRLWRAGPDQHDERRSRPPRPWLGVPRLGGGEHGGVGPDPRGMGERLRARPRHRCAAARRGLCRDCGRRPEAFGRPRRRATPGRSRGEARRAACDSGREPPLPSRISRRRMSARAEARPSAPPERQPSTGVFGWSEEQLVIAGVVALFCLAGLILAVASYLDDLM